MRQRTLTLLLAIMFVPAFVIACAGGNKEGSAEDAMDDAGEAEMMDCGAGMDGEEGHMHEDGEHMHDHDHVDHEADHPGEDHDEHEKHMHGEDGHDHGDHEHDHDHEDHEADHPGEDHDEHEKHMHDDGDMDDGCGG